MEASEADLAATRRLQPFDGAGKKTLSRLFADAVAYDFAADSALWREGDGPRYVYVLLSGYVGIKATDAKANTYLIEMVRPGTLFPLSAVVLNRPYLSYAETLGASRILMIPARVFRDCLKADAPFSFAVNRVLSAQRSELAQHVKGLKTQSPRMRLAEFLLSLTDRTRGEAIIHLPCERQMIAGWLGVVPSSASRAFRDLEKSCGIVGRGRQLHVRSVERLARYTDLAA